MARSAQEDGAEGAQGLLRVLLTISAIWLIFWAVIGGVMFAVAGPGLTFSGEVRVFFLAVFGPPAVLLTIGFLGAEALTRFAAPARSGPDAMARSIGLDHD